MLVYDLSNWHTKLEGYEVWIRKQERCPNEEGISKMVYRKFIKNMWWAKYEYDLLMDLVRLNANVYNLLQKLQYHFTADERYMLVKKAIKGENKDKTLLSLLQSI